MVLCYLMNWSLSQPSLTEQQTLHRLDTISLSLLSVYLRQDPTHRQHTRLYHKNISHGKVAFAFLEMQRCRNWIVWLPISNNKQTMEQVCDLPLVGTLMKNALRLWLLFCSAGQQQQKLCSISPSRWRTKSFYLIIVDSPKLLHFKSKIQSVSNKVIFGL